MCNDGELCQIFCDYFSNIISELQIPSISENISNVTDIMDPVLAAINTFKDHPSINNIREKNFKSVFSFTRTNKIEIKKIIRGMNVHKTCQLKDIPTKIIKMNSDIFANFICLHFNYCIDTGEFLQEFKNADIIPVHKKKEKSDKTNYRLVSILPNLSNIYEKLIYNQLYDYFDKILLPSQWGFPKGYISQHCLLAMLENFKKSADDGNEFGALLTDFSKAFDCIDHKLFIAKLFCYGVSPLALHLIYSYLSNRAQRIKINNRFSRRSSIEYGVPQGSFLGPLLFDIDLTYLFYECEDSNIANYADDTTQYACRENIRVVISELQSLAFRLFKWFGNNHIKANPGKPHILRSTKKTEKVKINDDVLTSSVVEKLLGITLDSELKFEKHITDICNKASQKIHVLSRITNYMSLNKRRLLMKTFVESQFNYCPLIRMFHSRRLNNKINNVHEKALRIVYSDYKSTFQELLDKDASFSVYHRNIQTLAIEIYKHSHRLSPAIMGKVFKINRILPYNLRIQNDFSSRVPKTVKYGTETISFLAPKV